MPYIIATRPEIQNGSVQVTDLFPNASQRNLVNDPVGQGPFYVRVPNTGLSGIDAPTLTTLADNSIVTSRQSKGLLVYLLANVEANGGAALTLQEARDAVGLIMDRVYAGTALTIDLINDDLSAAVGGDTDLDGVEFGSNSTGSLAELLAILSGEEYVVPAGREIQDLNSAFSVVIAPGTLSSSMRTLVPNDASWKISFSEGVLSGLTSVRDQVNGDLFAGVRSTIPLLTIYNNDGSVYQG
jgi:hypothetical protein